ncbi:MAG: LysR family transcriptional regulator [Candidatus Omnitrophica bacterium]|nr:LysR family transcriptional regulator [Candidatus Omnitrophota bacterium]
MIPFNYHHLYYFFVIARQGSIAKATNILRLAQPTVSAQLKQFERFLGVELFTRDNKRLILTEEGHQVLSYAKTIFDIGQELKDRMVDLSYKGRIRIQVGITNYVPNTIVEVLMNFILEKEPRAFIELEKNNMDRLIQDLDDHLLDIVLTDTPFESKLGKNIQNKLIGKLPIVFCAHPSVAKNIKKFPSDLDGQPIILPAAPRQIFFTLKEFFYEKNIHPEIIAEIQDLEIVRRLALRGHGIAPINILTIENAPTRQKLVMLNKPDDYPIFEKVYIITKRRKVLNPLAHIILKEFELSQYIKLTH